MSSDNPIHGSTYIIICISEGTKNAYILYWKIAENEEHLRKTHVFIKQNYPMQDVDIKFHEFITFPQIFPILEKFGTEYIGGLIFMSNTVIFEETVS